MKQKHTAMKRVMVFGTFNIIHPGHLNLFRQARNYGSILYVVLALDDTVQKHKKYVPQTAEERQKNLLRIPFVDHVIIGDPHDKLTAVKKVQPDVICLGYDQGLFVDLLTDYISKQNLQTKIIRLKPYYPEQYKGSKFRDIV